MAIGRFDEDKLKEIVIAKWRQGGLDRPVKVVPRGQPQRNDSAGYISQEKFIRGRTPEQMERILGFDARPGQQYLSQGADIYHFTRVPGPHEFALKGYTQLPGGEPWAGDPEWPPGLGAPQWQLTTSVPCTLVKSVPRGTRY